MFTEISFKNLEDLDSERGFGLAVFFAAYEGDTRICLAHADLEEAPLLVFSYEEGNRVLKEIPSTPLDYPQLDGHGLLFMEDAFPTWDQNDRKPIYIPKVKTSSDLCSGSFLLQKERMYLTYATTGEQLYCLELKEKEVYPIEEITKNPSYMFNSIKIITKELTEDGYSILDPWDF